jgi:hypothetical protein
MIGWDENGAPTSDEGRVALRELGGAREARSGKSAVTLNLSQDGRES